jgi:hypothetical protein
MGGGWGWVGGVHIGVLGFGGVRRAVCACGGLLVGLDWVVLSTGVAGAMCCCQWACRVGWY